MDDDGGFDDDGLQTGTASGAAGGVSCDVCGSTSCYSTDTGEIVCLECGALSQDVRNLEQEELDGAGGMRTGRGGIIFRRTRVGQRAARPAAADAFTTTGFLRALQHVLAAQTRALVTRCAAPSELHGVVGDVWGRYLARWAHARAPIAAVLSGGLVCGTGVAYYAKLRADDVLPATNVPPSMPLTLGVLYVACRWLSLPILPHDLAAWARNGTLPYVNAYGTTLQPAERVALVAARAFFTPARPPAADHVARLARALARNIGVALPRLNAAPCAARLINAARLPAPTLPIALQLLALSDVDAAHADAYGDVATTSGARPTSSRPRRGGAAGAAAAAAPTERRRLVPDELSRRRAAGGLDPDSAAAVAAVVYTAVRLLACWEAWVDVHLAPASIGGLAVARLRLGCTVGPWGGVPTDVSDGVAAQCCLGAGAPPPSGSGGAPSLRAGLHPPLHPDVQLPSMHDQVATAPAALLPAWAAWAGRAVLAGGDMAVGHGEEGYGGDAAYRRGAAGVRIRVPEADAAGALGEFAAAALAAARGDGGGGVGDDGGIDDALAALLGGGAVPTASQQSYGGGVSGGADEVEVSLKGRTRSGNVERRSRAWGASRLPDVAAHSAALRAWGMEPPQLTRSDDGGGDADAAAPHAMDIDGDETYGGSFVRGGIGVGGDGGWNGAGDDAAAAADDDDDEEEEAEAESRRVPGGAPAATVGRPPAPSSGGGTRRRGAGLARLAAAAAAEAATWGPVDGGSGASHAHAAHPAAGVDAPGAAPAAVEVVDDPARTPRVAAPTIVMLPCERQASVLGRPQAPRPPPLRTREAAVLSLLAALTDTAAALIAAHAEDVELMLQLYTPPGTGAAT